MPEKFTKEEMDLFDQAYGRDDLDELPAPPRKSIPEADRELLELAARAIGAVRVEDVDGEEWLILHFADGTETHGWNPLLFYADTFELAVRLRIDIMFHGFNGLTAQSIRRIPEFPGDCAEFDGDDGDDFQATARAVVRAAAEIGKAAASPIRSG